LGIFRFPILPQFGKKQPENATPEIGTPGTIAGFEEGGEGEGILGRRKMGIPSAYRLFLRGFDAILFATK